MCVLDVLNVMKGQESLLAQVFSRVERERRLVAEGREHELSDKNRRRMKNRAAAAAADAARTEETALAAEAAAAAEEEEEEEEEEQESSLFGRWAAAKEAVGEVEKEIAVDEATRAFGQAAISPREPWKGNLIDRTK
jgi:hypothetical protein